MLRNLLLPIETSGKVNAPVDSPNIGFVQFHEGYNLGTISDVINRNIQEENPTPKVDDHAIPSLLAHMMYTRDALQNHSDTAQIQGFRPEALYAWQGVLAVIGLSQRYGFHLSLETWDLGRENTRLSRILLQALNQEGIALNGQLSVICKDGIPLAVVHPDILFCPFKEIPAQALRDVPWFQDGVWRDLVPLLKEEQREYLAAWIDTFQGRTYNISTSLKSFSSRLLAHTRVTEGRVRAVDTTSPEFQAWRGVLAMVGLSQMYGFNLSFQRVDLLSGNPVAKDVVERCLSQQRSYLQNQTSLLENSIVVLYREQYPLAVVNADILLCPLQQIHPRALEGVPWYRDGAWADVASSVGEAERDSLAWWLSSSQVMDGPLLPAVTAMVQELSQGRPLKNPGKACLLGEARLLKEQQVCIGSPEDFLKVPGFPVDMPAIFNDRLAIAFATKDSCMGTKYASKFEVMENNKSLYFDVLLPLTPELTAEFEKEEAEEGRKLRLESISVNTARFSTDHSVTVEVTLQNGSFFPRRSHTYTADHIDYIPNLPYLSLWPYVSLPETDWKRYYISQLNNPADAGSGAVEWANEVEGERLQIDCNPTTKESGYENYSWKVSRLSRMPRCIHFYYQENNETRQAGCLFITPPEDQNLKCTNFNKTAVVGVDFGTTNTICSIKIAGGTLSHEIIRGGYLKDLTSPQTPKVKTIFTSQYWMPQEDKDGKFLSIVQMYANRNNRSDMLPYEEGSMMFVDQKVLNYFLSQSKEGHLRSLSEMGIYNDMKFGREAGEEGNAEESFAARIFIKNVLLNAVLAAKLRGADRISLNVSYPQEKVKQNLQKYWDEARAFIEDMDINLTFTAPGTQKIHYLTEAEAASRFFDKQLADGLAADPEAGFAIMDIGGGTTDISVWKADSPKPSEIGKELPAKRRGAFSLLYAGREIVVKSIYRQYSDGATENFKNLWCAPDSKDPETRELIDLYDNLVKMVDVHHNLEIDPIYKNIRVILDTLIDKCSFRYDYIFRPGNQGLYAKLVATIRLKFLNIFYVLANYIRELGAVDTGAGIFKIFLAGGSSQALRFCSLGEDLRGFTDSEFGIYLREVIGDLLGTGSDSIQIVEPQTSDKKEVAIGLTIPSESLKKTHSSSRFDTFGEQEQEKGTADSVESQETYDITELRGQWKECYEKYVDRYINCKDSPFAYGDHNLYESLKLSDPENLRRYNQSKLFTKVYNNAEYPQKAKPYIFAALMADRLL